MPVNLSARNYQLSVNGVDCTTALKSADGGWSHYDSTGLAVVSATFVLGKAFGFNQDLDDRFNPNWARGNVITLTVSNTSNILQSCPVLGHLYILKAEYDGIAQLTIEAGCILNLLSFRTPAGDGACFDLGEATNLNAIAAKLLSKAGAGSKWAGNIAAAPLSVPLPKLSNESYIELFGKLCWANGYLAYQDSQGLIRTKKISLFPPPVKALQVGVDEAEYLRLQGVESPVEIIKVSGVRSEAKRIKPYVTVEEEYGPAKVVNPETSTNGLVLLKKTRTVESIDRTTRTRRVKVETFEPVGLVDPQAHKGGFGIIQSENKIEEFFYELDGLSLESGDNCNDPDEGRLYFKDVEIYRPFIVALREYFTQQRQNPNYIDAGTLNLMLAETIKTEYNYNQKRDPQDQEATIIEPLFITVTQEPVGKLLPNESYSNIPIALYPSERLRQEWNRKRKDDWLYKESKYEPLINSLPELVEPSDSNTIIPIATKLQLIKVSERRIESNSGQSQPPAPERFPGEYEIIEKQIEVEVKLPQLYGNPQFRQREKEVIIDGGLMTSREQAIWLGRIEGHILWGRHKGQTCTVALADEFFDISPLDGVQWVDLSNRQLLFMADGFSVAFSNNRLAAAFDGVWSGTVQLDGSVAPPYQRSLDIELGSGSHAQIDWYPYSVQPQFKDVHLGSGNALFVLTDDELKQVEIGSGSGFLALTDDELKQVEIGSGSGLVILAAASITLGSGSGLEVKEVFYFGSGSGLDIGILGSPNIPLGSGGNACILISPSADVELGSGSGNPITELVNPTVPIGGGSGFEVGITPSLNVELGSGGNIDITELVNPTVPIGGGSGFEVGITPSLNVELGSGSGNPITELVNPSVPIGNGSGFEVGIAPSAKIDLATGSDLRFYEWDARLVTHDQDPLVTAAGERWVAYMSDMSHLGLDIDVMVYSWDVIANGGSIQFSDLVALNIFVKAAKANNLWDKILEFYPFAGDNLAAASTKLKTVTSQKHLTNFNLVEADYNRFSGVKGDGSSKRFQTGFEPSVYLQPTDSHVAAWITEMPPRSNSTNQYVTGLNRGSGQLFYMRIVNSLYWYYSGSRPASDQRERGNNGFLGGFFNPDDNLAYIYQPGGIFSSSGSVVTGWVIPIGDLPVLSGLQFGSPNYHFSGRLSAVSLGLSFNNQAEFELLRSLMRDLQVSLGRYR